MSVIFVLTSLRYVMFLKAKVGQPFARCFGGGRVESPAAAPDGALTSVGRCRPSRSLLGLCVLCLCLCSLSLGDVRTVSRLPSSRLVAIARRSKASFGQPPIGGPIGGGLPPAARSGLEPRFYCGSVTSSYSVCNSLRMTDEDARCRWGVIPLSRECEVDPLPAVTGTQVVRSLGAREYACVRRGVAPTQGVLDPLIQSLCLEALVSPAPAGESVRTEVNGDLRSGLGAGRLTISDVADAEDCALPDFKAVTIIALVAMTCVYVLAVRNIVAVRRCILLVAFGVRSMFFILRTACEVVGHTFDHLMFRMDWIGPLRVEKALYALIMIALLPFIIVIAIVRELRREGAPQADDPRDSRTLTRRRRTFQPECSWSCRPACSSEPVVPRA